jgi:mono/diheme cytochrome c family protein
MNRIQIEISLGVIFILLTGGIILWYGINEEDRMAEFTRGQAASAIEVGAALYETNCKDCHGPQGEGVPGLCPPLNDKYFFTERVDEVGWSGTIEDYIVATVSSGRLTSTRPDRYAGQGRPAMPPWAESYGGPLREDQIRNIAAFIMNWQATAPDRSQEPVMAGPPVGTDITVELPEGNPALGEGLATTKGCAGCHISQAIGPGWAASGSVPGVGARAETRYSAADYTGQATSAQQYLLESIVNPNAYVVEGYAANLMPQNYGETLTAQEAADLIAYMLSLK